MFKVKYVGVESLAGIRGTERLADAISKQNEKAKDIWILGNIELTDNKNIFSMRLVNKRTKKSKLIYSSEQMIKLIDQIESGNIKVAYRK